MYPWLRAFAQTTTVLGVVLIAVIWGGAFLLANQEREHNYQEALRQGSNLARVFEEYIARVIKSTDRTLQVLRILYAQNPTNFDLAKWSHSAKLQGDLTVQISTAGPDGLIKHSSLGPLRESVDISDREHFRVHANSAADELFISKPVVGRTSGKMSIQLSRRLTAADGSFNGVIVASLDPHKIQDFYRSVDVGREGIISLTGFDGIIRARNSNDSAGKSLIGQSVAKTKVLDLYRQSPSGSYWNNPSSAVGRESASRLITYRVVEGLPLLAVVGLAEEHIFQQATTAARQYYQISFSLTAFILLAIGIGAVRKKKLSSTMEALERSKSSLEQTNYWFETALENMAHGLCMFDHEQRLLICNSRYGEMYGLTPEQTKPGTTMRSILEARVKVGNCPEDGEEYIERRLKKIAESHSYYIEDELRNGQVFAISHETMQGGGWVGIHQDITERRLANAHIEAANRELITQRYAMDQAVIVTITDVKGNIAYVNDNFCRTSGFSREELLGQNHRLLNSRVHSAEIFRDMYRRIEGGEVWRGEICNRAKDGSLYWVDTTIVPRLGKDGKPMAYMAISIDITAQKQAETQIVYMARHDALTGLDNRVVLFEKMEEALVRLRNRGDGFALFVLDLDLFKAVNDSLGHPVGDELLTMVAQRLLACVSETDTVVRLGGDEFAILRTAAAGHREDAIVTANKLLERICAPYNFAGHTLDIGTSIGVVLAPEHGADADLLVKNADLALYKVKSEGRNNYRLFEAAMSAAAINRRALEIDMRNALSQGEFGLHYQPIVDAASGEIVSVEALIRWRHPQRGMIPPNDFIPIAEEVGLIHSIGEWVLRKACADAGNWPPHIKLAVNLSAVQFRRSNLIEIVSEALSESGLSAERLELEITESVLMQANAENLGILHQLRNLGIAIVLDDYGTGYASLSYLQMFPFDKIKIDQTFVGRLSTRPDSAAIVCAVTGLGRSLNIVTVAEGVETEDQLELLRAAGCIQAQGYLFGRPCPVAELEFTCFEGHRKQENAA